MSFSVVLTGGIASGKSEISRRFEELGVPVIDTDVLAREVVEPGEPALQEIRQHMGEQFIGPDGRLDRKAVREAIFRDPSLRKTLEAILHPAIGFRVREEMDKVTEPYCLLVIPLFNAGGAYAWVDRVLVVDVPEELQLERVMQRDGIDEVQARAILAAQISRTQRLALADDVIENTGALESLDQRVRSLHERYLELACSAI